MWLPKDERKTLRKYHSYINTIDEYICFNNISERANNATRNLIERRLLLEFREGHPKNFNTWLAGPSVSLDGFLSISGGDEVRQNVVLKFNLEGLDLARKYSSWWSRSNLWYSEYIRYHWICVIVAFMAGIIGGLLINWLS
jgi:hypothetical protein